MAVREPRGLSWWPSLEGLRGESQAPVAVTVAAGRGHPPGPVAQSAEFMTLVLHFVLSQEPRRDDDAHVSCPCDTGRQRQPRETLRPLPGRPHAAGAPPRRAAFHLPRPLPGPASTPARVCSPGSGDCRDLVAGLLAPIRCPPMHFRSVHSNLFKTKTLTETRS